MTIKSALLGFSVFINLTVTFLLSGHAHASEKVDASEIFFDRFLATASSNVGFKIQNGADIFAEVVGTDGVSRRLHLLANPGSNKFEMSVTLQIEEAGNVYPIAKTLYHCFDCTITTKVAGSAIEVRNRKNLQWQQANSISYQIVQGLGDSCQSYYAEQRGFDANGFYTAPLISCMVNNRTFVFDVVSRDSMCPLANCQLPFVIHAYANQRAPIVLDDGQSHTIPLYNVATKSTQFVSYRIMPTVTADGTKYSLQTQMSSAFPFELTYARYSIVGPSIGTPIPAGTPSVVQIFGLTRDRKLVWNKAAFGDASSEYQLQVSTEAIPAFSSAAKVAIVPARDGYDFEGERLVPSLADNNRWVATPYSYRLEIFAPELVFVNITEPSSVWSMKHAFSLGLAAFTAHYKEDGHSFIIDANSFDSQSSPKFLVQLPGDAVNSLIFADLVTGKIVAQGNQKNCVTSPAGKVFFGEYSLSLEPAQLIWTNVDGNNICELRMPLQL